MSNVKQYAVKSLSVALFAVMLHTYLCSVLCITGAYSCCGGTKTKDSCRRSCCDKKKNNNSEKGDCQNEHFAFFKTMGQFHALDGITIAKIFQPILPALCSGFSMQRTIIQYSASGYNRFHPPPEKADISILTHNFRI